MNLHREMAKKLALEGSPANGGSPEKVIDRLGIRVITSISGRVWVGFVYE